MTLTLGPKPVVEAAAPALDALWARLAAHVGGAYANFLSSITEADVAATYPAETLRRLATQKGQYDPANLFAGNHNVRPSSSRSDGGSHSRSANSETRAPGPLTLRPRRPPRPVLGHQHGAEPERAAS